VTRNHIGGRPGPIPDRHFHGQTGIARGQQSDGPLAGNVCWIRAHHNLELSGFKPFEPCDLSREVIKARYDRLSAVNQDLSEDGRRDVGSVEELDAERILQALEAARQRGL